jgi:hypothetical protein
MWATALMRRRSDFLVANALHYQISWHMVALDEATLVHAITFLTATC